MKATNQNQRAMREYAERHDTGYDARAREIRAENMRRTAKVASFDGGRTTRLMHDICSTPYATVLS